MGWYLQFNSLEFLFLFLPVAVFLFYFLGKKHRDLSLGWLTVISLIFYGWWNPSYLQLITVSILVNYFIGIGLQKLRSQARASLSVTFLSTGILFNLLLLGYFKYANFFVNNLNALTGSSFHLGTIVLPLAISFFTFQQITFLVDSYKEDISETDFLQYCAFVTFFPHLIAGPICRHKEVLPQFAENKIFTCDHERLSVGLTIFIIGLFKKVVLADGIAFYATPVFDAAERAAHIGFFDAWGGALAYTFQLYFDFSGYSDMAIGVARMFGILLPLNFNSPYKSTSIIEFWRNWHITLSRLLRDYLYFPLGGNRKGKLRGHANLMLTMTLGGVWHGAGWTFVAWGALHGVYLVINHMWRDFRKTFLKERGDTGWWGKGAAQALTFIAVVAAWVLFRARSFDAALNILQGMAGMHGFVLTKDFLAMKRGLIILFALVMWAPNTQQIMLSYAPTLESYYSDIKHYRWSFFKWEPSFIWFNIGLIVTIYSIYKVMVSGYEEFIYQFF